VKTIYHNYYKGRGGENVLDGSKRVMMARMILEDRLSSRKIAKKFYEYVRRWEVNHS
jgi:hypothetical protein